jgi:hypothetical protein
MDCINKKRKTLYAIYEEPPEPHTQGFTFLP